MARLASVLALCGMVLTGCTVGPPDPTYISSTPADAASFAVAQDAVRACSNISGRDNDPERTLRAFRRAGFTVTEVPTTVNDNTFLQPVIDAPSDDVIVFFARNLCYVGLIGMTPEQSAELASIWADAYGAHPHSYYGDGVTPHASEAWRLIFTEPPVIPTRAGYHNRIQITAYKTWPHGPYDIQRGFGYDIGELSREVPGAAVVLRYRAQCQSYIETEPGNWALLPC